MGSIVNATNIPLLYSHGTIYEEMYSSDIRCTKKRFVILLTLISTSLILGKHKSATIELKDLMLLEEMAYFM